MEHSRRDFLKKAAVGSAGVFMLNQMGFNQKLLAQDEDLSILPNWIRHKGKKNALYNRYYSIASSFLTDRKEKVSQLTEKDQWQSRQKSMRDKIIKCLGGEFPEKTPLNAEITGYVDKDDYRIEKVIFESLPEFHVTGCLFIPKNPEEKKPAIIYCSGHTNVAFRSQTYQHEILNLVKKGFMVFAIDPIGQGERLHYYNPDLGRSMVGGATKEHSYPGAQCFLTGDSIARYFIWDGIRAVDYLLTREEVDPDRLGITGRSGGGTQSAYIGALDDRILASAPECYITSFKRLIQSIGPQDAEQNFYRGIEHQIDHADLLEQRVPKPTMMVTTTRDIFSIQGARETAREVEGVYEIFGKPNNFSMIEDNAPHASTKRNRQRKYAFFQEHFNVAGSSADEEVEYLTPEELTVTETGQVLTSRKSKSTFLINKEKAEKHLTVLKDRRKSGSETVKSFLPTIKKLSGFTSPQTRHDPVFTGRFVREGYTIEKYFVKGTGSYKIPYLLFRPEDQNGKLPVVLYLHPGGKAAEASPGGEIEAIVKKGYAVLAPDLVGVGELGPAGFNGDAYQFELGRGAYNIWFFGLLVGKSMVGSQAADLIRLVDVLKNRSDIATGRISSLARGGLYNTLLHAAAFEDTLSKLALINPLLSYESLVMHKYYRPEWIQSTVPGAITGYDLPDLAACIAPRPLWMVDIQDHRMKPASQNEIDRTYRFTRNVYQSENAQANFVMKSWDQFQNFSEIMSGWLSQ